MPPAPHRASAPEDNTRDALVATALEAFAAKGVQAVSLRQLTIAAGSANQSAVHYHFKNKRGLVLAVLDEVNRQLAPLQSEAMAELDAIAAGRCPSIHEIVGIGLSPYVYLNQSSGRGAMAIRFLSRLTWESGAEGQELMLKRVRPYFLRLMPHLRRALPDKPVEVLDLHLYMAASNVIHGMADIGLLTSQPGSDVDRLYRDRPQAALDAFFRYISGGLGSGVEGS